MRRIFEVNGMIKSTAVARDLTRGVRYQINLTPQFKHPMGPAIINSVTRTSPSRDVASGSGSAVRRSRSCKSLSSSVAMSFKANATLSGSLETPPSNGGDSVFAGLGEGEVQ